MAIFKAIDQYMVELLMVWYIFTVHYVML